MGLGGKSSLLEYTVHFYNKERGGSLCGEGHWKFCIIPAYFSGQFIVMGMLFECKIVFASRDATREV
jgi:hypothetical protein